MCHQKKADKNELMKMSEESLVIKHLKTDMLTLTLTACVAVNTRTCVAIDVVIARAVHTGAAGAFVDVNCSRQKETE